MDDTRVPQDIELDCPFCEGMVACREFDELVICPHCERKCRQINDYMDEAKDKFIFALVPLDSEGGDPSRVD
jgi:hypothetical protein